MAQYDKAYRQRLAQQRLQQQQEAIEMRGLQQQIQQGNQELERLKLQNEMAKELQRQRDTIQHERNTNAYLGALSRLPQNVLRDRSLMEQVRTNMAIRFPGVDVGKQDVVSNFWNHHEKVVDDLEKAKAKQSDLSKGDTFEKLHKDVQGYFGGKRMNVSELGFGGWKEKKQDGQSFMYKEVPALDDKGIPTKDKEFVTIPKQDYEFFKGRYDAITNRQQQQQQQPTPQQAAAIPAQRPQQAAPLQEIKDEQGNVMGVGRNVKQAAGEAGAFELAPGHEYIRDEGGAIIGSRAQTDEEKISKFKDWVANNPNHPKAGLLVAAIRKQDPSWFPKSQYTPSAEESQQQPAGAAAAQALPANSRGTIPPDAPEGDESYQIGQKARQSIGKTAQDIGEKVSGQFAVIGATAKDVATEVGNIMLPAENVARGLIGAKPAKPQKADAVAKTLAEVDKPKAEALSMEEIYKRAGASDIYESERAQQKEQGQRSPLKGDRQYNNGVVYTFDGESWNPEG